MVCKNRNTATRAPALHGACSIITLARHQGKPSRSRKWCRSNRARSVQRQPVLPEAKNTQREPQRPQRSESVGRVGWLPRAAAPPAGHLGIILHWHVAS